MKKLYILMIFFVIAGLTAYGQYQQTTSLTCFSSPAGTPMTLSFTNVPQPASAGVVTFYYQGDLDATTENFAVFDEGTNNLGTSPSSSGQCLLTLDSFKVNVTKTQLAMWAADGIIDFNLDPTTGVSTTLCTPCTGAQAKIEYFAIGGMNDAAVLSIDSPKVFCAGSESVYATIGNTGMNQIDSVDVHWEIDGILQPSVHYVGLLDTINGSNPSTAQINLGNYTFPQGLTEIKVYTSNPNGVADTSNNNDTISIQVRPSLIGNYTVDSSLPTAGRNFNNINDFNNALANVGMCGPVVTTLAAQVHNGHLTIEDNAFALTIDGVDSSLATLTHDGSIRNSTIFLNRANDVNLTNMTIESTGGGDSWGVQMFGDVSNINVANNNFKMPIVTTIDIAGINISGSETTDATTALNVNNINITNNSFSGGEKGIAIEGGTLQADRAMNISIIGNNFTAHDDYGMYISNTDSLLVTNNIVDGIISTTGDGAYFSDVENFNINTNYFSGPDNGMYITDANSEYTVVSNATIFNNMIIGGDDGLYVLDMHQTNLFHNSIYAEGYALYLSAPEPNLDLRNNIFYSNSDYALYVLDSVAMTLDNNIYNTNGVGNLIRFGTTTQVYPDLASFQAAVPSLNINSLEGDPLFMGPQDLHATGNLANDAGDNSVGITTDYDGETRPMAPSTIVDIGADEFMAAGCQAPSALMASAITSNSADLSWTETGTATEWQVEYGSLGFTQGNGTFIHALSDSITVSGLNRFSDYEFYVRAICGPNDTSIWSGPTSFTTTCGVYLAPFSENFDNLPLTSPYTQLPNCWEPQQGPDYWDVTNDVINTTHTYLPNIGDHTTGSSNYMWIDASSDITANGMVTPMIDLSGLTTPYVGFWFASNNTNNSINHTIALDAWDGTAWVNVTTQTGNFPTWVEVASTLPPTIPSVTKFRIHAIANPTGTSTNYYYNDLGVDDFFVMEGPTCFDPTNLTYTSTSATSADISWTSTAPNTIVEYGAAGFNLGTGTQIVSTTNTESITGLTPNIAYEAYIRDSCGPGDNSNWVGPITFGGDVVACDNFDAYSTGNAASQSLLINGWGGTVAGGGDAEISTDYASSGTQSLKIHDSGTNAFSDVVAEFNDHSSGVWNLAIDLYVPTTNGGYYNILHNYTGASNVWAVEITLDANGTATVEEGTNGTGTIGTFNYTPGAWNTIEHIIDLNNDTAYIIVNGVPTNVGWQFSLGSANFGNQFNAMNFYSTAPTGQTPLIYFDNFCVTSYVIPTPIPHYQIGTINTVDANGVADSLNVEAWISGTVAGVDLDGNAGLSFTVIDQSGSTVEGISVYNLNDVSNYVVNEGDSISLRGIVSQTNGLQQFVPDSVILISTGHALPAHMLSSTLDESTESQLIRMEDLVVTNVGPGTSFDVTLTDGTNNFTMYVDEDTDVDNITFTVGDNICFVNGIGSQDDNTNPYTAGYEIVPMRATDVGFNPIVDLGQDTVVCDTAMFMLDAGSGFASYSWNVGGNTQMVQPTANDTMYIVTVTDAFGCSAMDTISVTVDICTGLDNNQNTVSFAIAPNPSKGMFRITANGLNKGETNLTVRDISGKIIYSETVTVSSNNFKSQINLEGQAKGIYFISVTNKDQVIHNKVVIQ